MGGTPRRDAGKGRACLRRVKLALQVFFDVSEQLSGRGCSFSSTKSCMRSLNDRGARRRGTRGSEGGRVSGGKWWRWPAAVTAVAAVTA